MIQIFTSNELFYLEHFDFDNLTDLTDLTGLTDLTDLTNSINLINLTDSTDIENNFKSCYVPNKSTGRTPMDCPIPWVDNWIVAKVNQKGDLND